MTVATVIQTIQLIIAPVVMVTACAILLTSIQNRYATVNDRLRAMARERLELFRVNGGARLTPPAPTDAYGVERLAEIDAQIPRLLRRHRLIRDSLLAIYVAVLIFLLSMLTIAAAFAVQTAIIGMLALALFLTGTTSLVVGVALTTIDVRLSHDALRYEVNRVMDLGR
jgi:Protein of unknown function (DUF2721)